MQADNDNLAGLVEGFDDWEALHEAVRKVVEALAYEGEAPTKFPGSGGMAPGGQTDVINGGRADHARRSGNESVGSTNLRRGM